MIEPIVPLDWVRAHPGPLVLADARFYLDGRSARAAYEAGHIPGAVFVDVEHDLAAPDRPPTEGRHPLPAPEAFAAALAARGICDTDLVVAYDDSGGGTAGRLVHLLRVLGLHAALLDGGLAAWPEELETGTPPALPEGVFRVRPWPADRFADADTVGRVALEGPGVVLDARSADRYRGETEPIDPRAGHVPGARNAPWPTMLGADGRFASAEELRASFAAAGIDETTDVICYCGSGVSACADLLALERAGIRRTRLFVPSWSGWSSDPARPVETTPR